MEYYTEIEVRNIIKFAYLIILVTAQLQTVAVEKKRFDSHVQPFTTYDAAYEQDFVKVELWRYAPIRYKDAVDPFSLYASLQESTEDERTQDAMNELYRTLKRMVDDASVES